MADSPVMPSNPCEKVPGSNRIVVSPAESSSNCASRHEWPKCVSCIPILCGAGGIRGYSRLALEAGGGSGGLRVDACAEFHGQGRSRLLSADLRRHPRFGVDRADIHPAL